MSVLPPCIPGRTQPSVLRSNEPHVVPFSDSRRVVRRSIVNNDDFVVRIIELREVIQAFADSPRTVITAHDHRHERHILLRRERTLFESLSDRRQCGSWPTLPIRQTELPIVHVAEAVPLIRPRKHYSACAARLEAGPYLPVQDLRLCCNSVTQAIQPQLAHHERTIESDVLQSSKISTKLVLLFQKHVEAAQIEEGQLEILGARIIDICHQSFRVFILYRFVKIV